MEKKAQVWVETVIYTLIGLAIIGILLSVSRPKINEMKDRMIIEQTIDSLNKISAKIFEVQVAPGNKRILEMKISKGIFYVNASENKIGWIVESNYKYSEIGSVVALGNMEILTIEANPYLIHFSTKYTSANITYDKNKIYRELEGSPTPYSLSIENRGSSSGNNIPNIDLVVS